MGGNDIEGAGSVSTDQASIGSASTINNIEFGDENLALPTASSDDSVANRSNATYSISLNGFSSEPSVFVTAEGLTPGVFVDSNVVSASQFDIRFLNYSSTDWSSESRDVSWLAIS
jgi:hypothetical protein